jgi:hypothetical protein
MHAKRLILFSLVATTQHLVYDRSVADPIPRCVLVSNWFRETQNELESDAVWTTFWGHDGPLDTPPRFAMMRSTDLEFGRDGIVWMHVGNADNVRELVALMIHRMRPWNAPFHAGRIRHDRIGADLFQPDRVVFFIHDDAAFESSHAFVISAEQLFETETDVESKLEHVTVYHPAEPVADGSFHRWIYGSCSSDSLNNAYPLPDGRSRTLLSSAWQGPPVADTERGAEFDWDPVTERSEPWNMPWGATQPFFYNFCEYEREPNTGDLVARFYYRRDARPDSRLRDVIEFAFRQTRFTLQCQFGLEPVHPLTRSVRGTTEFPPPERFVVRVFGTPYVAVIPAEVLFARETTVERAIASTWIFKTPDSASENWVEALSDPGMELMPDEVWNEVVLPFEMPMDQ